MTKSETISSVKTDPAKDLLIQENTMLRDALNAISDGFVVFDADDVVIAFNKKHQELFPSLAPSLKIGVAYKDLLRAQAESGQIEVARGREEEWVQEWAARHQVADGTPREQIFANGKIMRLNEYRTSFGASWLFERISPT